MAVATRPQASGTDWAVKQGLIGGSIAGIVFAFVEMLGSVRPPSAEPRRLSCLRRRLTCDTTVARAAVLSRA